MPAVYYCWLCGRQVDSLKFWAPHYEDPERFVRFCSWLHLTEYLWLAGLQAVSPGMKVRYAGKTEIAGDSSSLNMHGTGEVIVWYADGSASSEEISELEVYLDSQQRWVSLSEAFRNNDVITDNRVTRFAEPRSQAERDRGWSD